MNLTRNLGSVVLSLAGVPGGLVAQATVEHAAISGGAAIAGSAQSVTRAISGALKNLGGAVSLLQQQPAASSEAARIYEDPVGIKAGMASDELLRRFGEPSMKVTGDGVEQTFYYPWKDGQIQVQVSRGRVVAVDARGKRPEAAVVE